MFNLVFGIRGILIGAGVALLIGTGAGWKAASVYYNVKLLNQQVTQYKEQVEGLEENLRLINAALGVDSVTAQEQAKVIEELKRKEHELESRLKDPDAVVLDGDDARRVRDYFK